jgi:hypothetical protein
MCRCSRRGGSGRHRRDGWSCRRLHRHHRHDAGGVNRCREGTANQHSLPRPANGERRPWVELARRRARTERRVTKWRRQRRSVDATTSPRGIAPHHHGTSTAPQRTTHGAPPRRLARWATRRPGQPSRKAPRLRARTLTPRVSCGARRKRHRRGNPESTVTNRNLTFVEANRGLIVRSSATTPFRDVVLVRLRAMCLSGQVT